MKTNLFIKFSLCLLLALSGYAQTSKTYTESFDVNKDVEVFLNANNAEITIETWNKNRVDVKATISVELENKELSEKLLERIPFEALGNSSKVEINTIKLPNLFELNAKMRRNIAKKRREIATERRNVATERRDIAEERREIAQKRRKIAKQRRKIAEKRRLIRKDTLLNDDEINNNTDKPPMPQSPPSPPIPPLPPMPDMNFDMERFNEEGNAYLQKFQKEIREKMKDSNFRKEMRKWQNDFVKGFNQDSDTLKFFGSNLDTYLEDRKVKKKITIKMPKNAKLNLNVKRSQLKIAELNNIDANLNYSGLQIDELIGNNCKISAKYSKIDIANAETLDLELKYSKDVNIGNVEELISISKTSNLVIENLGEKAIIEGTFGELDIKNISDDFAFIDINLKNSSATLKIPHDDINFYINSKSSDFSQNTSIDFKMNSVSDAVIFQNSKPVSNRQSINIKADFSTLELKN